MQDNSDTPDTWLSAPQVAQEFDVKVRTVYRWIERGEVTTKTSGKNKFVTRDSVVALLRRQQISQLVTEILPQDTPTQELKESLATSVTRNDSERQQLYLKAAEDARVIGELTERTRHLDTLSQEVSGLRKRVERLIQYRVLFWVLLVLFVIVVVIFSVLLYANM
jgi:DNA-binding transcriptional regulator YhcF (GntR family)